MRRASAADGRGLVTAFHRLRAGRWLSVGGLVFGLVPYLYLRGIADDTGIPPQEFVARAESMMSGGSLPTEHLQRLLHHPGHVALFDEVWLTIYALWFPVAVLGMVCFAVSRWEHFRLFAAAWLGVFYVAIVPFVLLPTSPPWMLHGVVRVITEVSGDLASVDTNQVAALPSLHVGVPAMIALRARASGMSRLAWAYGLFTTLTAFAVVYLGEHFVLDAVAGVALAWLVVKVSARFALVEVREVPDHVPVSTSRQTEWDAEQKAA